MSVALFVLSTGRCGTQWLAEALHATCGDAADVRHEPLDNAYEPRRALAAGDNLPDAVREHVEEIECTLAARSYVECGHPSWSTIPYLLRRFEGRARVVHLVRHPVPVAWSWVTQAAYCPPPAPHLREKVLLSPFDEGTRFPEYRERWSALQPYEKALYYWAEVNALGLDVESGGAVPVLRVRYEEMFDAGAIRGILSFAGIERDAVLPRQGSIDRYAFGRAIWTDPRVIDRHPEVVNVAQRLGYEPLAFDEEQLRRRYAIF